MSDQSAPSELATTDVAWQALLQNSRPTLTHFDAGAGATYAGGGLCDRGGWWPEVGSGIGIRELALLLL